MAALSFFAFDGEIPRTSEDLLTGMTAREAENVNLLSGEARPIHGNKIVYAPAGNTVYQAAYRALSGGVEKWRVWPGDVNVAKGPFNVDVEPRYYWTGDGVPKFATFTDFGTTDRALGVPPPANAPGVAVSGGAGTIINRAYAITFYRTTTGEESGVSKASALVAGARDGTWTITTSAAIDAAYTGTTWDFADVQTRIYRTTGSTQTFQLVAQVANGSTYVDTLTDDQILGDELISSDWLPPPAGLQGLIALPNGSLCGFTGTLVCFSEPYQPHAWPVRYQYGTDYPVVGIAAYGTTVVVATSSVPYTITGTDPGSMSAERTDAPWPCTAKRSVISVGDGVLFSTNDGLAYIGTSGSKIFTASLYTRDDWEAITSDEMSCAFVDERVYVMCRPPTNNYSMIVISPGDSQTLTRYVEKARSLYVDPNSGTLYMVNTTVDEWDENSEPLRDYNWLSRPVTLPNPTNFGAAAVRFVHSDSDTAFNQSQAAYTQSIAKNVSTLADASQRGADNQDMLNVVPEGGSHVLPPVHTAEHLAVTFYFDDAPVTVPVSSTEPFRLPSGFKARRAAIRLAGNVNVMRVDVAETMLELKTV